MPTDDYSTDPAARNDTAIHLVRGLAHQACMWHDISSVVPCQHRNPQTRSTTEQNTQQGSQYQGYLERKTQSPTRWTCQYKIPSVPLCFDNWPPANHNQRGQCLGRFPNLAAIFWQVAQMYMYNLFRCSPAKQR